MKTLYIIAWIALVLSVIVHLSSVLGPEDMFWDVDAFVWLLHGGAILLGFPAVLCAQKLSFGRQDTDSRNRVLQNCPSWMRNMVGFFVLYGIANFIIFMTKSTIAKSGGGTPMTVFKGFSGHWMVFYSIEMAIFYSCLKKKLSDPPKNMLRDQILSMNKDSGQQYDSSKDDPRTKWSKYSRIIMTFVIVAVIFIFLLWLAIKGYPWFLGCTLFSLFPFVVIQVLHIIYFTLRWQRYMKKNHFQIWKKGKSTSLADRVESQRLGKELDDPYLNSLNSKVTRFSKILLYVWLVTVGLVIIGLVLLPKYYPPSNS